MPLQDAIRFTGKYRAILEKTWPLSVILICISFTMSQLACEEFEACNCPFAIFEVACSQVYSARVSVNRSWDTLKLRANNLRSVFATGQSVRPVGRARTDYES